MSGKRETLRQYYDLVDEERYQELFALFAEDVVYERPGQDPLEGKAEFERFYLKARPLRDGSHTLHDVLLDGDTAAVRGSFSGVQDGESVTFGFADFHTFDDDGKIAFRYTYTDRDTV